MDTNAVVHIKKGEARALKAGGAWIYDNEIDRIEGEFENGDIVTVLDFDGYCLGYGFINTRSKITVRMLSRRKDAVIDEAFLEMRVRNAWEYRKATVRPPLTPPAAALSLERRTSCRVLSSTNFQMCWW